MAETDESEPFFDTRVVRVYDGSPPIKPRPRVAIRSPFLDDEPLPIKVTPDEPAPAEASTNRPLRPMIGKDPNTFREFQRVFENWDFRIGTF